jgi:hypothetical protein
LTYSHVDGDCVDFTTTLDELRDSKDPHGPTLKVDVRRPLAAVKSDRCGRP